MPALFIKTGEKEGVMYPLSDETITIGRGAFNRIVLPDAKVSHSHARILFSDGTYIIEDSESTNGTFVNSLQVARKELAIGDEILFGATRMAFISLTDTEKSDDHTPHVLIRPEEAVENITIEHRVRPDAVNPLKDSIAGKDALAIKTTYKRLKTLYEISSQLSDVDDLQVLLQKIVALVVEATGADRGFALLIDKESGELLAPISLERKSSQGIREIAISKTIIHEVISSREGLLISNAMQDGRFQEAESIIACGIHSAMCVPMKFKNDVLGIIHVDIMHLEKTFSKDDLELLSAIGSEVALAINNAQLFEGLKRTYNDLKEKQSQLIESEKLGVLGQLAGGIVHEINNPLTLIINCAAIASELIDGTPLKHEEIKKHMRRIREGGFRCHKIAEDLLHLARRKKPEQKETNINDVIEGALEVGRYHMTGRGVEIIKRYGEALPIVMIDAHQMQQVFLNLVINAKDAMEKEGTLTIETRQAEDEWLEVLFSDTGCGIPSDKMEAIFKPLFTTKDEGKGTGLGLSVSKEIVENHNGIMHVESTVGKGTTFIMRLPLKK